MGEEGGFLEGNCFKGKAPYNGIRSIWLKRREESAGNRSQQQRERERRAVLSQLISEEIGRR